LYFASLLVRNVRAGVRRRVHRPSPIALAWPPRTQTALPLPARAEISVDDENVPVLTAKRKKK